MQQRNAMNSHPESAPVQELTQEQVTEAQRRAIQEGLLPMILQSQPQLQNMLPNLNEIAAAQAQEAPIVEPSIEEAREATQKQLAELWQIIKMDKDYSQKMLYSNTGQ